jgi:hypothetical protein
MERRFKLSALTIITGASLSFVASAAEVKSVVAKDGRVIISISGEIVAGDADNFKSAKLRTTLVNR